MAGAADAGECLVAVVVAVAGVVDLGGRRPGAGDSCAADGVAGEDPAAYRLTAALRQALGAAVRWRYMTTNPTIDAGQNPEPRSEELDPFTPEEIDALVLELGAGRRGARRLRRRKRGCARTSGPPRSGATSTAQARPSPSSDATRAAS